MVGHQQKRNLCCVCVCVCVLPEDVAVKLEHLESVLRGIFGEEGGVEPHLLLQEQLHLEAVLLGLGQDVGNEVVGCKAPL